jgi:RimJ/RimL family protein N-acetyltransferase
MAEIFVVQTPRVLLRQWLDSDLAPFTAMGQDAEVMKFFPKLLSCQESAELVEHCSSLISKRGWGFWAAEEISTKLFIGFIGLNIPSASLPFSPCVEIGWRLARPYWNQGFAREGAQAALDFAFNSLQLSEVVSFTALENTRSEAVMKRLEMKRDALTFEHPFVPEGHVLRQHCLYRKQRPIGSGNASC